MAKHIRNEMPGVALRALMDKYKLHGNQGADFVALLLGYSRISVQGMLSRGMRRNDYRLLELLLKRGRLDDLDEHIPALLTGFKKGGRVSGLAGKLGG